MEYPLKGLDLCRDELEIINGHLSFSHLLDSISERALSKIRMTYNLPFLFPHRLFKCGLLALHTFSGRFHLGNN